MESKDHVREIVRQAIEDSWESEESEESVLEIAAESIEEIYSNNLESFRSRVIEELEGMKPSKQFKTTKPMPIDNLISEAIEKIKNLK